MSPQLYLGGYPTDIIYILIYLFISIIPCFMQEIIDHSRTHWLTTVTIELILTLWLWQWLRVAVSIQLYCELWCCLLLLLSCYVEQATMCKTYISLFLDEVAKGSPTKLATPQELSMTFARAKPWTEPIDKPSLFIRLPIGYTIFI